MRIIIHIDSTKTEADTKLSCYTVIHLCNIIPFLSLIYNLNTLLGIFNSFRSIIIMTRPCIILGIIHFRAFLLDFISL